MSILFQVSLRDLLFYSMKEMGEYLVSNISEGSAILLNEGNG